MSVWNYMVLNLIRRVTKLTHIPVSGSFLLKDFSKFGQVELIQNRLLYSAARRKLERIHAKNEHEVTRSQELLQKLRRKKLEGLAKSPSSDDVQLGEKLSEMKYIRRLLSTFHSKKEDKEMTLKNTVIILTKVAELFERQTKQRDLLLANEFHRRLVKQIVHRVSKSSQDIPTADLCGAVAALAKLKEGDPNIYTGFEKAILHQGIGQFDSDAIGLISYSFAKANIKGARNLLTEVAKEVDSREIVSFSSKSLCQIAWAFTSLKFPAEQQLKRIGMEVLSRDLGSFSCDMLSILAHAYSTIAIDPLSGNILMQIEREIHRHPELKKFPSNDLVMLTTALLHRQSLDRQTFRKLETVLVTRRDFLETTSTDDLQKLFELLKESPFFLAEIVKILETVLYPNVINSVFDIFYRPRRSWKEKVLKQSVFKVY